MNPAYDYSFLLFNARQRKQRRQPNALFADIGLRRAISMGLDRAKLVRSQFDSLAIVSTGPMTRAQPLADSTIADYRATIPPVRHVCSTRSAGHCRRGRRVRERRGPAAASSRCSSRRSREPHGADRRRFRNRCGSWASKSIVDAVDGECVRGPTRGAGLRRRLRWTARRTERVRTPRLLDRRQRTRRERLELRELRESAVRRAP